MDKWLWAARFFKTRAWLHEPANSAGFAPTGNRPSPLAMSGSETYCKLPMTVASFRWKSCCSAKCVAPRAVAQTLYRETEASRELRQKLAEERKATGQFETSPEGRPSKRDRRQINRLRGRA